MRQITDFDELSAAIRASFRDNITEELNFLKKQKEIFKPFENAILVNFINYFFNNIIKNSACDIILANFYITKENNFEKASEYIKSFLSVIKLNQLTVPAEFISAGYYILGI